MYTYELIENGYIITGKGTKIMQSNKPPLFFPYPGNTIEESAQNHINELMKTDEDTTPSNDKIKTLEEITAEHEAALVEAFELIAILMEGGNE